MYNGIFQSRGDQSLWHLIYKKTFCAKSELSLFIILCSNPEAIIVVPETALANIQKALTEVCEVKMRLDFVAIPAAEDWGTADTLRHIKDKIMVRVYQFQYINLKQISDLD